VAGPAPSDMDSPKPYRPIRGHTRTFSTIDSSRDYSPLERGPYSPPSKIDLNSQSSLIHDHGENDATTLRIRSDHRERRVLTTRSQGMFVLFRIRIGGPGNMVAAAGHPRFGLPFAFSPWAC
jgi:hypothetical protein